MSASVVAVSQDSRHRFSKPNGTAIRLIAGVGVEGDSHSGMTVQHLSRVRADPSQPNLRQVHLMHVELHDELRGLGHDVKPGDLGENLTTHGIDLLGLPLGTLLRVGAEAVLEVTGLRNPCQQINDFSPGLLKHVVFKDSAGKLVRKAGIMTVVRTGGVIRPDDPIAVELPDAPHLPLEPV
jgi:MOSC domain-containing protein YiiM